MPDAYGSTLPVAWLEGSKGGVLMFCFWLWPLHTPSSVSYLRCISLQLLACRVRCSQRDITRMASEIRLTREMDGITIQVRPVHRGRVPSSIGMSLARHCSSNEKGAPLVQVPKPHETYMP